MITDIVQGLKHKSKSSIFKVQSSMDKMFKVQRIIREIRSRCLNFLYIIVKEMVGERVKNE